MFFFFLKWACPKIDGLQGKMLLKLMILGEIGASSPKTYPGGLGSWVSTTRRERHSVLRAKFGVKQAQLRPYFQATGLWHVVSESICWNDVTQRKSEKNMFDVYCNLLMSSIFLNHPLSNDSGPDPPCL